MYYRRKLRQGFSITGLIPAMACLAVGAIAWVSMGLKEAFLSVAVFFVLYSLFSFWVYVRTLNLSYIAASLWQLLFGLIIATRPEFHLFNIHSNKVSGLIVILWLAATVFLFYTVFSRKAKWKGREIFEIASMSVEPDPDGFTERPHPAGRAVYTRDDLEGFAAFVSRNLIAMPYRESDRIVFVLVKMEDEFEYMFRPEKFRQSRSWVAFDFSGNVTVNISRKDYLDYREEFSFDQLCNRLGALFIRFMEYYRKGEAERIIYQLNELGLGLTH